MSVDKSFSPDTLRNETNSILKGVSVNTYPGKDLQGSVDGRILTMDVNKRLEHSCKRNVIRAEDHDLVITIEIHKMVVAACTMDIQTFEGQGQVKFYDIHMMCAVDLHNLRLELLREVERYAIKHGVFCTRLRLRFADNDPYVRNDVPRFKSIRMGDRIRVYRDQGYSILPVKSVHTIIHLQHETPLKQYGTGVIMDVLEEIGVEFTSSTSDNSAPDPDIDKNVLALVESQIGYGTSRRGQIIRRWTNAIKRENLDESLHPDYIFMWKNLRHQTMQILPGWNRNSTPSQPSDSFERLASNFDAFLGMFNVKIYDMNNNEFDGKYNMEDIEKICQESIDFSCLRREFTEDLEGKYTVTIEMSDTILSFAVVDVNTRMCSDLSTKRRKTSGLRERCMTIHLLCGTSNSGLGSRMLTFVEDFANVNKVSTLSLQAVPDKVEWYMKKGFIPGHVSDVTTGPNEKGTLVANMVTTIRSLVQTWSPTQPHNPFTIPAVFTEDAFDDIMESIVGGTEQRKDLFRMKFRSKIVALDERLKQTYSAQLVEDDGLLRMSKVL